jgi:hypothetical protein
MTSTLQQPPPQASQRPIREGNIWINENLLTVVSDRPMAHVMRLWWSCPSCGRKCRYLYLRDTIGCARCHKLQHASRHLRRQTPQVGRVERLRKKLGNCELRPFAPLPPCRHGPTAHITSGSPHRSSTRRRNYSPIWAALSAISNAEFANQRDRHEP